MNEPRGSRYFFGGFCAGGCDAGGAAGWELGCVAGADCAGAGAGAVGVVEAGAPGFGVLLAGAGAADLGFVCSITDPIELSAVSRLKYSVGDASMNTIAHDVVARDRNVAAPRGPNAVWLPAPPKAPAKSAALPLCSMMTITNTKHTATCSVTSTNGYLQPIQIRANATNSDTAHFAQLGI